MGKIRGGLALGRSLATGALVGLGQKDPARLSPLSGPTFRQDVGDRDPSRVQELDRLIEAATIAELQQAMATGTVTCEELTGHLLIRALDVDPALNSIIELNPEILNEARAADARRAAGDRSALLGIPVTVKDNIETAGPTRTTAGAELLVDHVAGQDATVVTALREAGAVILGTANLSELAGAVVKTPGFSAVGGQTVNPYGRAHSPGGSSSGSAVSVAAGLAVASVGTETSGSLIAPAAFNGVVGMKPSRGLVDGAGIVPLVRHQDSAGPLGRTVADAAALLQVLSGGQLVVDLTEASLDGVRVGVLREDILGQRSALEDTSDGADILERIEGGLRAAAAVVVPAEIVADGSLAAFDMDFLTVVLGGLTHDTMGYLARTGGPVSTLADLHAYNLREPRRRMPKGQFFLSMALARQISLDAYETAALAHRATAQRILDATFDAADADVLASVANSHSTLYATAGYPAVTVPLGLRSSGMPTGVTLIGRPGTDGPLLGQAHAFEQATRLRVAPTPPVLA
jgi:amidase